MEVMTQLLLCQGRGLPIRNVLDASSDPYCVFSLVSASAPGQGTSPATSWQYRSKACKRTLTPQWNLHIPVPIGQDDDLLKVEVHDQSFWTAWVPNSNMYHYMCQLSVCVRDITSTLQWFQLYDAEGKPAGELQLARASQNAPPECRHKYRKYYNRFVAALQGHPAVSYFVCEVTLMHVDDLFQRQRQGWNKSYKAAQMIYGQGPESIAARLAVATQHKMMYSNIPTPETGYITNSMQFLELLENGVIRNEPRPFTYVIVEKSVASAGDMEYLDPKGGGKLYVFRFSETGIAKATDYFSKHAMHANAAEDVIYAGEFHVILEGGVHTLYLDNNSGTFAPDGSLLPLLEQLFTWNFPGLAVRALSHDSEELKRALQSLHPVRTLLEDEIRAIASQDGGLSMGDTQALGPADLPSPPVV